MKKLFAVLLVLLALLVPAMVGAELIVEFDSGEVVLVEQRVHPSEAMHFDVYSAGGSVAAARYDDIEWTKHGSEHADLSEFTHGYWHFVLTPSGILTISNSNGWNEQPPVEEPPVEEPPIQELPVQEPPVEEPLDEQPNTPPVQEPVVQEPPVTEVPEPNSPVPPVEENQSVIPELPRTSGSMLWLLGLLMIVAGLMIRGTDHH